MLYFWVFLLPGLVTLELLFGKKYRTLGIMERLAAKWKQTMAMKSNNKTEGRGTVRVPRVSSLKIPSFYTKIPLTLIQYPQLKLGF